MSDEAPDNEQKTEQPTEKRKQQFREDGQIAFSTDLVGAGVFSIGFALILGTAAAQSRTVLALMRHTLSHVDEPIALSHLAWTLLSLIGPFAGGAFAVAVLAGIAQVGLPNQFLPKLHGIHPVGKFTQIFGKDTLIKLLKQLARTAAIAYVVYASMRSDWPRLLELSRGQLPGALSFIAQLLIRVTTWAAFVLVTFGVLDYVLQKYKLNARMKMTLEEVKREMKEEMPSPELKAKRRSMQRAMSRNKIVSAVQAADVILVNPTHYAVALKYQPGKGGAPKVVAKGVDHLALRIREIATEAKVPIVQNIPLARALYAQVKVGRDIPVELYRAVAEILALVYKKRPRKVG